MTETEYEMEESKTTKDPIRDQKFKQASKKHFVEYEDASDYRKTLKEEKDKRIRIRRREFGFDVVFYEKIAKEKTPKKEIIIKSPKNEKFKKGKKKKDSKPKKKPFNQIVIEEEK